MKCRQLDLPNAFWRFDYNNLFKDKYETSLSTDPEYLKKKKKYSFLILSSSPQQYKRRNKVIHPVHKPGIAEVNIFFTKYYMYKCSREHMRRLPRQADTVSLIDRY